VLGHMRTKGTCMPAGISHTMWDHAPPDKGACLCAAARR
jgi:hypothetical protein